MTGYVGENNLNDLVELRFLANFFGFLTVIGYLSRVLENQKIPT